MRDELLGKTSPETISTAAQLGRTYTSLKRDQDAIRIYEDRLAALRTDPSADLDAQVTMMNNLAVSYDHLGQMDRSEKLRLEMLQILPKLPEGTLTIALIERNVALLHLKKSGPEA
jgi:lipopolysaccharide biosynthesis regulator YciM